MPTTKKIYEPYFCVETHIYHSPSGMRLECVTDILQGELGGYSGYPESAAIRGHHVHTACQFFDEGDLDEEKLREKTPEYAAYFECYKAAKIEYGITVLQNEARRYHPKYLYAGTCDKICIIGGVTGILDLKTGQPEKWHAWQVAAYRELLRVEVPNLTGLWTLYIKPGEYGGKGYRLVAYTEPRLFGEFLALYSAYQIKKNAGLIKEKRKYDNHDNH